jgi:pimeloyl-ACP methyl ester carboxylesterase
MKPQFRMLTAFVRVVGTLLPPLGAEIGYALFRRLGTPQSVRTRDRRVHERARVEHVDIGDRLVRVYAWGTGGTPVLLVHGWRSRASRFSDLVEALESPERTILAFDAPGNGDSPGDRTTVLDYASAITHLGERYGRFEAIVGHSFGVLATFIAVREGVRTDRIVSIAGSYSFDHILATFVDGIGLPTVAVPGLRRRILRRIFPLVEDPTHRFLAEVEPTDTVTELLVVHDELDPSVEIEQGRIIADAHNGPTVLLETSGLGHSRILSDPVVVAKVRDFVSGVAGGEPDQLQGHQEPMPEVEPKESSPASIR